MKRYDIARKFLPVALSASLALGACMHTQDYKMQEVPVREEVETELTLEEKLQSQDYLESIADEENRYHWTSDTHLPFRIKKYNPSIAALEYGLENKDLVVILKKEDNLVAAEEARMNYYQDLEQATISYKVEGEWYETSPLCPEGNIDLNHGDEGGIYRIGELPEWPEDSIDGILFRP